MKLTPDQQDALDFVAEWVPDRNGPPVVTITGPAGTGKTTLLRTLRSCFGNGIVPIWTATTGKAARRVSEAVQVEAGTLHSVLYFPPADSEETQKEGPIFEKLQPAPANAVVIVDEASMITPQIMEDINQWISLGTRFVLTGDPWQLPPILTKKETQKYGEHFTVFAEDSDLGAEDLQLHTVMRTQNDLLDVVTHLREAQRLPTRRYKNFVERKTTIKTAIDDWLDDPEDHALITWRNQLRMQANAYIRNELGQVGVLPQSGEPVLFCRNGQGVLNGQIGIVRDIERGPALSNLQTHLLYIEGRKEPILASLTGNRAPVDGMLPWIDKWGVYQGDLRAYCKQENNPNLTPIPVTWGYTFTAHKAQGSEWRRASIFLTNSDAKSRPFKSATALPDGSKISFGARWLYTALTRAREHATLTIG